MQCFGENLILQFVFLAIKLKWLLRSLLIAVGSVMVLLLNSVEWGTVAVIFLIKIIVLIPFQVSLMIFQLFSKYFV